jgi:hypothetical protein
MTGTDVATEKQLSAKRAAMNHFSKTPAGAGFAHGPAVLAGPNVLPQGSILGVGLGIRSTDGMGLAGEDVVRVYVTARDAVSTPIPKRFAGLPSEVLEVGDIVATALLTTGQRFGRHRPTSCGVSVGHPKITAGTLGCRVRRADGSLHILSNNHVLADCNAAALGDAIIQPGTIDGGMPHVDDIATLSAYQPLDFSGAANDFDAAIAELDDVANVESAIIDIGAPGATPMPAALYQSVRKHGRTTGHTVGVIVDVSVSLWIGYGLKRAWFQDQIAIQGVGAAHFSAGGDSGSLMVDAVSSAPVALLFAGSTSGLTFGNPIDPVLLHFGVAIN